MDGMFPSKAPPPLCPAASLQAAAASRLPGATTVLGRFAQSASGGHSASPPKTVLARDLGRVRGVPSR